METQYVCHVQSGMNLFWTNLLLHAGYNILLADVSSCNFVIQGAENRGTDIFSSLASSYETNSKKDCLCAFSRLSVFLSSLFFFSIFAAHSLSPEVENLK